MPISAPFWWGVSSSAYQNEEPAPKNAAGDEQAIPAFKTDWDLFVEDGRLRHAKAEGTQSFRCFERDIAALRDLGVTHYRYSVEWARVQPAPGRWDEQALARYVEIARALKRAGITPVVCLWHFTFPDWLTDMEDEARHGWLHPHAAAHWNLYVDRVVDALADEVSIYAPQNEPNTQSLLGYVTGTWPPLARFGFAEYAANLEAAGDAFLVATEIIRDFVPGALVTSVQSMVHWQRSLVDPGGRVFDFCQDFNFRHLDRVAAAVDLIGFNYYSSEVASPAAGVLQKLRSGKGVSDMGWVIDPGGLEAVAGALWTRYQKPLLVLENGIADASDEKRGPYISDHVAALRRAQAAGAEVRGYFHWTLVDNFEWAEGYRPRFGLYSYDSVSGEIRAKESANVFKRLIAEGG